MARHRDLYLHYTNHLQDKDIHAAGGIRTRNPSMRTAADLRHFDDSTAGKCGGLAV
jgi:hypothetical protein